MSSDIHKKFPLPSAPEEDLEQALAMVWSQLETGQSSRESLEKILDAEIHEGILGEILGKGFLQSADGVIVFSPEGKDRARPIVRRHRLAERLLQDVLTVSPDQIDPTACRLEHVISSGVEEAICTLLGHPQVCPHGGPIPPGSCCERAVGEAKPIVFPLSTLKNGDRVRIVYLSPGDRPELHKFIAMGLVPGTPLRIVQTYPTIVVEVDGTLVAMEPDLARHIFVRKSDHTG